MTPIEQWKALKARCNRGRLERTVFAVMDLNIEMGADADLIKGFVAHVAKVYDRAFPPQPLPAYERPEPTN